MDKIENPYLVLLERLHNIDQSIHILNLVNNDLQQILQKKYIKLIYDLFFRNIKIF